MLLLRLLQLLRLLLLPYLFLVLLLFLLLLLLPLRRCDLRRLLSVPLRRLGRLLWLFLASRLRNLLFYRAAA